MGLTFLVIDPTSVKAQSIQKALDQLALQYEIKYFPGVPQALSIPDPEIALRSDLAILNFSLPYIHVHVSEAIRKLREVHSLSRTPMVVIVYNEWEASQVREADGVLRFPITADGIREILELVRPY